MSCSIYLANYVVPDFSVQGGLDTLISLDNELGIFVINKQVVAMPLVLVLCVASCNCIEL